MKKKYIVIALACSVSMSYATKIGVLKADKNFKCSKEITIDLDVEDSHNATGIKNNTDKNPPGISLGGHAVFNYCVLDVDELPKVPYDYMVLRMDSKCPTGAYKVARHHDTEDSNNKNSPKNSSTVWPSVINNNATLEYCFVPATDGSKNKYPLFDKKNGHKYGVFARKTGTNIAHSEIYIDDEDNKNPREKKNCTIIGQNPYDPHGLIDERNKGHEVCEYGKAHNSNYWNWYPNTPTGVVNGVRNIMDGDANTTYHTIRWTPNSTSGMLAKSAEAVAIDVPMAAMPTSASIRGLDRSAITVELKSAGNAKISVVNVNGAVVASFTQENLMPGVHQIKWNSNIVPNGLYIVKVMHNGMVSSKSVILK